MNQISPPPLAVVIKPWTEAIETASRGMGEEVLVTAAETIAILRRRAVLTAQLEAALIEANTATKALANSLDQKAMLSSSAKAGALVALGKLINQLEKAQLKDGL